MSTRSVPLTAMGFATLASAAPGRVFAGVGTSSPAVVEGWHGLEMPRPVAIAREYLPALRRALAGERLTADGEYVRSRGFRLTLAPATVPIVLAAINPRMLRLAGELADGVLLTWGTDEELAAKVGAVRDGARAAGRDPAEVRTLAVVYAYAGPRTAEARERLRRFLTLYASLPTHRASFRGALDLDEFAARWEAGDRAGAAALVDDEVIDRTTAFGSPERVAARVRDLWAAGVEVPLLMTIGAAPGDAEGICTTIEATARALNLPVV
jgi:alkanesulfonate monooxygenase SsuD/methylene tetrahydromethanopterin reductase-like flavin-dependent oxidoreductase (luciferase family)